MENVPDMIASFPGAIVFIIIGAIVGAGYAIYEGARSGDDLGGVVSAWQTGGLGAAGGVLLWFGLGLAA
jgi:hypothetical protein